MSIVCGACDYHTNSLTIIKMTVIDIRASSDSQILRSTEISQSCICYSWLSNSLKIKALVVNYNSQQRAILIVVKFTTKEAVT